MRKIKFRCWSKKHRIMWICEYGDGREDFDLSKEVNNPDSVVMQFTGLLDREGKEIWEGDVIQEYNYRGVIEFYNGCFCVNWQIFFGTKFEWHGTSLTGLDTTYPEKNVEVLGNVWESPELLNGTN